MYPVPCAVRNVQVMEIKKAEQEGAKTKVLLDFSLLRRFHEY